uniref:Uncharacterized protein n=1 Tax=Cacopsylla melanoneura TaxID=428564 RepID=A0A8D8XK62_9HEMI
MIYFKFYYYDSIRSVPINKVFIFMVFLIPFFVFLLTMNHSLVFFFFAFFPHSSGVGIFYSTISSCLGCGPHFLIILCHLGLYLYNAPIFSLVCLFLCDLALQFFLHSFQHTLHPFSSHARDARTCSLLSCIFLVTSVTFNLVLITSFLILLFLLLLFICSRLYPVPLNLSRPCHSGNGRTLDVIFPLRSGFEPATSGSAIDALNH